MRNRLKRHEKQAIRDTFQSNLLYQLIYPTCKDYEQQSRYFRLSPEEVFWECMEHIDYVKTHTRQESINYLNSLWSVIYCDFRELASDTTPDSEILTFTAVVLYALVMYFSQSSKSVYVNFAACLLMSLNKEHVDVVEYQAKFTAPFFRMDSSAIANAFAIYIDSDTFLSDEIEACIDSAIAPISDVLQSDDKKFTLNQSIILLVESLNVALNEINISAMDRLIFSLTGKKGARSILQNLKNGNKEYNPIDAETVATAIDEISPSLAQYIRNSVEE